MDQMWFRGFNLSFKMFACTVTITLESNTSKWCVADHETCTVFWGRGHLWEVITNYAGASVIVGFHHIWESLLPLHFLPYWHVRSHSLLCHMLSGSDTCTSRATVWVSVGVPIFPVPSVMMRISIPGDGCSLTLCARMKVTWSQRHCGSSLGSWHRLDGNGCWKPLGFGGRLLSVM